MAYIITLSNGNSLTTVTDESVDNTTSLTLLGRSYVGYGGIVAENFVYLLENFASINAPLRPLTGQLWYNASLQTLEVYDGTAWQQMGPYVVTTSLDDSSTSIATTAYVKGQKQQTSTVITGTNHTYSASDPDYGIIVRRNSGVVMIDTLPGTSPGVMPAGWSRQIFNNDATAMLVFLIGTGTFLDYLAPPGWFVIGPNSSVTIWSDGTQYFTKGKTRAKLYSNLDFYVSDSTGLDTNHGLTTAAPFKTIQQAIEIIYACYDLNLGFTPQIHVANGTYSAGAGLYGNVLIGGNSITIIGNNTSPMSCKISLPAGGYCFSVDLGGILRVSGFALEAPSGGVGALWEPLVPGTALVAARGGLLIYDSKMAFGPCSYAHMSAGNGGFVGPAVQGVTYNIYGDAPYHCVAGSAAGIVSVVSVIATATVLVNFERFVWADSSALVYAPLCNFSGVLAVLGVRSGFRYIASSGGFILVNGGGPHVFPGTVEGAPYSTTGYYF